MTFSLVDVLWRVFSPLCSVHFSIFSLSLSRVRATDSIFWDSFTAAVSFLQLRSSWCACFFDMCNETIRIVRHGCVSYMSFLREFLTFWTTAFCTLELTILDCLKVFVLRDVLTLLDTTFLTLLTIVFFHTCAPAILTCLDVSFLSDVLTLLTGEFCIAEL